MLVCNRPKGCARDPRSEPGRWARLCCCTSGGKAQEPLSCIPGPLRRIRTSNGILFGVHHELGIAARESAGWDRERSQEIREGCGGAQHTSVLEKCCTKGKKIQVNSTKTPGSKQLQETFRLNRRKNFPR